MLMLTNIGSVEGFLLLVRQAFLTDMALMSMPRIELIRCNREDAVWSVDGTPVM